MAGSILRVVLYALWDVLLAVLVLVVLGLPLVPLVALWWFRR